MKVYIYTDNVEKTWFLSAVNGVMPAKRKKGEVDCDKSGKLGDGTKVFEKMPTKRK